jgi:hypothetical protein
MPSSSGNLVHQMHVTHSSLTLESFISELSKNDFLIVEEFYKKFDAANNPYYESQGLTSVNYRYVGKVKELGHRSNGNNKYGDGYEQTLREIES